MTGAPFPQRPSLRLVPPAPPPRPRRIEVRFHVLDGRSAFGRSRVFHLAHNDLERLIATAERLEARV
jgi:hypothetical protein